jgi:hypothetical protein
METKICSKCNIEKSLNAFHQDKSKSGGRRASCSDCNCLLKKIKYENTRDNIVNVARGILAKSKERAKKRFVKQQIRKNIVINESDLEGITEKLFNLDLEWIFKQRELQNNKCHYTNIEMLWSIGYIDNVKRVSPFAVSIERIDSSKGYTKNNCVLSCWWANCSKGAGTIGELIYFSSCVVNKHVADSILDKDFITLHGDFKKQLYLPIKDNTDYQSYKTKEERYDKWPNDKKLIKLINKKNYINAAKELNVSSTTLKRYIQKKGLLTSINVKLPRAAKSIINWPNDLELVKEIKSYGLSIVSKKLDTSNKVLRQRLKRKNLLQLIDRELKNG